jgi:hypothetical protein
MVFVENPVRRMIIQQCDKSRNRIVHSGGVLLKWNRIDPDFSGNMETIGKHEHHKDETFKLSLYPSR